MRHDFYATIHKAIRRMLSDLLSEVATADGSPAQWRSLEARLDAASSILHEHAHHEEAFIHPLLAVHAPGLVQQLADEHARLDRSFADVRSSFTLVDQAPDGSRREPVFTAYRKLSGFVANYFVHMGTEESEAMPALWNAWDDSKLLEVHGALIASMSTETMRAFLTAMLPAINHDERVELVSGIRLATPPPVFEAVLRLAQSLLPPTNFDALRVNIENGQPG